MSENVAIIYKNRFGRNEHEIATKNKIWQVLCRHFFQKWVAPESVVLDIGAGYCEFINNIQAQKKIAIDVNADTQQYAEKDVICHKSPATNLHFIEDNTVDVIFISNFFEHMQTKGEIEQILRECRRVLKRKSAEGQILILQPNIRFAYKEYWDFFDHHIPLSDKSLVEVLEILNFKIERVIPRFLPYSTKSKFPKWSLLIRIYLCLPFAWRIFGKQVFIVASRREA